MALGRPDPPVVGKVTHRSIELFWKHVKNTLPANEKFKFLLQESDSKKKDWETVYAGNGVTKVVEPLEPCEEYNYRLCIVDSHNSRSDFSPICTVKTTKEPLSGENLHKAIHMNKLSEIEAILDSPDALRVIEIPDKIGNFPLMTAVLADNLGLVELLIQKGASVNAQNEAGKTALMIAAFCGFTKIIKELRYHGASYELRDRNGLTTLHYAIDGANLETITYILYDGADVNAADTTTGWTPLIRYASLGGTHKEIAEMLIKFKADVNILDFEKKSAIMIATINGNQSLVELLVENGADTTIKNNYGKSLYDLAISMDRRRLVKYFNQNNFGHHNIKKE